ncbi:MAG TPA: hypothetical protein VFH07_01730, partial [Chitinophagaceae bacterium]|nr:hypothetical protein [Chitinophagaceae bacterium]
SITNLELIPYTDAENAIIRRFAYVFQQSYTRFLDLEKAEAQAREAKIEASLERVRAKTMAMHKSSDLLDVVKVLGEQFELLGFKFQSVNFDTDFQEKDWNLWLYNVGSAMYPGKIHIPYIDHPCFNRPLEAFKKGGDLHSFVFTKEEKDSLFDHIYANSVAKYGSDERKRFTYAAPGFAMSIAVTKNTRITIANYNAEPFSEEENTILRRFANVFEQSYTRFLDLQKAEAQAREAEIELALERVRARTMAMQKSDELREAVRVIYEQLKLLHFESSACNIIIIDKESNSAQYWVSGFSQETFPVSYTVPYFNHPYQDALLKPWKQGAKYVVYEYAGKMKQNFDEIFFTQTDFKNVPAAAKNVMIGIKSVMLSTAFMTYGALQSLGAEPLSEENANILQRFAKVFEQTYTRFLDLQKAEAQAREAQIEAALERVRSRTMAMQKTDELLDAAELVHKELAALGINSMNVSYAFVDEDEKYGSYYSINPVDGKIVPIPFVFPHTETEMMRSILSSWKKQESFNVIELKEKATLKHQTYIGEHIQQQLAKINVPFSIKEFLGVSPKKAVLSTFNFANGYLFNIGEERLSKIQEELMLRFTRVFEQTYTRFLDLQKAEAQAREAQIEAALERVRSRTMAMQKTDELLDAAELVHKELAALGINSMNVSYAFVDEDEKYGSYYSI